jgi:FMN phosphatase YigB (HAD superfamily)
MVTDVDKDLIFDEIVNKLDLPRDEILIVDDRIIRGIRYGNKNGHPTVWFQNDKFADELPNKDTKEPTYMIHSLLELKEIL